MASPGVRGDINVNRSPSEKKGAAVTAELLFKLDWKT